MSVFEWGSGETAGGAFETWEMPGESEQYEEEQYEDEQYEQQESGQLESEAALETELAYELLSVSTEAELEEFLGKLVKGVGKFMKSGVGKAIGGVLRGVAKTALPMVGSALGSLVLPGVGTALGGQLGSMASKLLEAEEAEMLGEQAELRGRPALRAVGAFDRPQCLVRAPIGATVAGRPQRGRHRGPPSRPGAAADPPGDHRSLARSPVRRLRRNRPVVGHAWCPPGAPPQASAPPRRLGTAAGVRVLGPVVGHRVVPRSGQRLGRGRRLGSVGSRRLVRRPGRPVRRFRLRGV